MRKYAWVMVGWLSFGLSAWAATPDGAQLFARNCAACHGSNGNGGVGVPLALPDFQNGIDDNFLIKTIRVGRPGRVMPAFTQLSDAEVKAIVAHIRTWVPQKPFHARMKSKGNAKHGAELFAQRCAVCHGAQGGGGHGTGVTFSRPRDLPIIAPAINNPGFLAAASNDMLKATLMHGREGTPMVSFTKQGLSEQDIEDIVAHVRGFEKQKIVDVVKQAEGEPDVIVSESPFSLQETVEAIKRAAVGKNFRIIRVQEVDQGMVDAGKENPKQIIIYFCNFEFLNHALAVDPRVGMFLPCRVTAVEGKDGKVTVYAINPKNLSRLFNNAELDKMCTEMFNLYTSIVEEATL